MINFFKKIFNKTKNNRRLNVYIVNTLQPLIKEYARVEAESGILLPVDFKTDPGAWLDVLRNIEYSFDELNKEYLVENISFVNDEVRFAERRKKIQKGLELFGKYLMEMN